MKPIFLQINTELCSLPLPTGYPLSWTHAGICFVQDGVNGYKYFLTCTPYPNGNDAYENPMFYYANPREDGKAPIVFNAFSGNPLQDTPAVGYNADSDIIYLNGNIYVTNRQYDGVRQWVNVQKCSVYNGQFVFSEPITLYTTEQEPVNFGFPSNYLTTLVSPSVVKCGEKVRFYQLATNSYNDLLPAKALIIMEGDDLETSNSFTLLKYGSVFGPINLEPWHMSVFPYDGKLYSVICCVDIDKSTSQVRRAFNYLAVSEDWENFRIYPRPLCNIASYRSAACVNNEGVFVLYLATLSYDPVGNLSTDGRNIVMASMPFVDLLKEIDAF